MILLFYQFFTDILPLSNLFRCKLLLCKKFYCKSLQDVKNTNNTKYRYKHTNLLRLYMKKESLYFAKQT